MSKKRNIWDTKPDETTSTIPDNIALQPFEPYIEVLPEKVQIFENKIKTYVRAINPDKGYILVEDQKGNGIRIPYNADLHGLLAIDDELEIELS